MPLTTVPHVPPEFSLLVVDECHHTHKDSVYNIILSRYLEHKLQKAKRLPQVLGLTASPGTGGATKLPRAIDHVLQVSRAPAALPLQTTRDVLTRPASPQPYQPYPSHCGDTDLVLVGTLNLLFFFLPGMPLLLTLPRLTPPHPSVDSSVIVTVSPGCPHCSLIAPVLVFSEFVQTT